MRSSKSLIFKALLACAFAVAVTRGGPSGRRGLEEPTGRREPEGRPWEKGWEPRRPPSTPRPRPRPTMSLAKGEAPSWNKGGTPRTPTPKPKFSGGYALDLAFIMDTTGSMRSYIEAAKQNIRNIVDNIEDFGASSVRLALINYRDHRPEDKTYVTDVLDFTPSVSTMKAKLDGTGAAGGGDTAEAVADALCRASKLRWRPGAVKIAAIIADAPPHGLNPRLSRTWKTGCPLGLDPVKCTDELAEKGIILYSVGAEPSLLPYRDFFTALAEKTGGQYVPLGSSISLPDVIIGSAAEEMSLQRFMADVTSQVKKEARGGAVDEDVLARKIYQALKNRGVTTKKLKRNNKDLPEPSARAKKYSKMSSLAQIRGDFAPTMPTTPTRSPTRPRTRPSSTACDRGSRARRGVRGAVGPPCRDDGRAAERRIGAPGPRGRDGAAGPRGRDGAAGPSGRDGDAGSKGRDGSTVFKKSKGPSGPSGPSGPGSSAGSASDKFTVKEEGVSLSQVHRLVSRAAAQAHLRTV